MDSATLEDRLQQIDAELARVRASLDASIDKFAEEVVPLAAKWIDAESLRAVERRSDAFAKLTAEQVQAGKEKIAAVKVELPTHCKDAVKWPMKRPHNQPADVQSAMVWPMQKPDYFFDSASTAVGALGGVLNEMGLLRDANGFGSWEYDGGARFKPKYGIGGEVASLQSVRLYRTQLAEFQKLREEHKKVTGDLSKAKARERWDST